MKKITITIVLLVIVILVFIEKCSLINLSTADIFRPKECKNLKGLLDTIKSKNFEIVPLKADFPILFDSIRNEFYLSNKNGLTKIDAQGNIMFSDGLLKEKYTSVFYFNNFTPYFFSDNGVYDFSGDALKYIPFLPIENLKNEISPTDFNILFEKYYNSAEIVLYDTSNNRTTNAVNEVAIENNYPIYFKIKNDWILMFYQKDYFKSENNIIGQYDLEKFPAKLGNKKLIVLKENKNNTYSTKKVSELINDEYLNTYKDIILKEKFFDYQTNNDTKIVSYKKESYYSRGSYLALPGWASESPFLNIAYFQLNFNNDTLFFKEQALKERSNSECTNEIYLYEIPKKFRNKTKVAFLNNDLNLGAYMDEDNNTVLENKSAGLYLIRPKKNIN